MLLFSVIFITGLAFIVWASSDIGSGVFIKAKCKNAEFPKGLLLTFDDGPHPENTPLILEILEKNGVKAVFFVTGAEVEKYPEIVKKISERGHLIGNHSFSHSNFFPFFFKNTILSELQRTAEICEKITGKKIFCFRPPFGVTNPRIAYAAKKLNYVTVGWSVRSKDTVLKDSGMILKKVLELIKGGDIILLHDTVDGSVKMLDKLINQCRTDGLEFIEPVKFLSGE